MTADFLRLLLLPAAMKNVWCGRNITLHLVLQPVAFEWWDIRKWVAADSTRPHTDHCSCLVSSSAGVPHIPAAGGVTGWPRGIKAFKAFPRQKQSAHIHNQLTQWTLGVVLILLAFRAVFLCVHVCAHMGLSGWLDWVLGLNNIVLVISKQELHAFNLLMYHISLLFQFSCFYTSENASVLYIIWYHMRYHVVI